MQTQKIKTLSISTSEEVFKKVKYDYDYFENIAEENKVILDASTFRGGILLELSELLGVPSSEVEEHLLLISYE